MKGARFRSRSGAVLAEVLLACSIGVTAMAGLFSAAIAIQRCFAAAEDFADAKADQARLSDYLALDLRRALSVSAGTGGDTLLSLEIPDYYDAEGNPRTPTITKSVASYGPPGQTVTVVYRKIGSAIGREESGKPPQLIAANVEDFELTVQDLGKVVTTAITFAPPFERTPSAAARASTTVFNTTLLRNIRKDSK